MYVPFEEQWSDGQRVLFSEDFERLCWPLGGLFPTALSVMKTMHGALQEMEPLQQNGIWREIAFLPLTQLKVSSINAYIPMLDEYEGNWVVWHRDHETAEYVANWNLDDYTWLYGKQEEDCTLEMGSFIGYIASCCGQDRPEYKAGLIV